MACYQPKKSLSYSFILLNNAIAQGERDREVDRKTNIVSDVGAWTHRKGSRKDICRTVLNQMLGLDTKKRLS